MDAQFVTDHSDDFAHGADIDEPAPDGHVDGVKLLPLVHLGRMERGVGRVDLQVIPIFGDFKVEVYFRQDRQTHSIDGGANGYQLLGRCW